MTAQQRLARLAGLVPTGSSSAARTPFVLLVVVLLGAGMLALLLLNAALNQGSFELSELRRETSELTDEQQALQAEVDAFSAPHSLAERARELGLVPGGPPVFLLPDGGVLGVPEPAPEPEPEPEPEPVPRPEPDPDSPPAVPEGDTPNGRSSDGTGDPGPDAEPAPADPDAGDPDAEATGGPTDPAPEETP